MKDVKADEEGKVSRVVFVVFLPTEQCGRSFVDVHNMHRHRQAPTTVSQSEFTFALKMWQSCGKGFSVVIFACLPRGVGWFGQ